MVLLPILNLINYGGANGLYILLFGSNLTCLDHINSIVPIYGYYVLRGHNRKQFDQIEESVLKVIFLRLIEGNEDI